MKRGRLSTAAATGLAAATLFTGCADDPTDAERVQATDKAYELKKAARSGLPVTVFQGAVYVNNVNARPIPAAIDTNNAALRDGVITARISGMLIMRPFVIETDKNERWIAGYFEGLPWADSETSQTLGFIAVNEETEGGITSFSRLANPARLCPQESTGTTEIAVSYNQDQTPFIMSSGVPKAVATALQVPDGKKPRDLLAAGYRETPPC